VRQPYAALPHCHNQPNHALRITHHASHPPNSAFRIPHSTSAFTLAEVLASLVFMAILIPVALEALSIATRAGEVAARKGEAALVAERVLNENVATTNWNQSVQSGSVRQGVREFRWTLHNDPWNQDLSQNAMRQLSVEVIYTAQGHDYSVRMSTLVDSTPPGTQSNQVQ
jgi:competence protein ComGC